MHNFLALGLFGKPLAALVQVKSYETGSSGQLPFMLRPTRAANFTS